MFADMSVHVQVHVGVCLLCDLYLLFTRRQLTVITQREIACTVRKSHICCKILLIFIFFNLKLTFIAFKFLLSPFLSAAFPQFLSVYFQLFVILAVAV